MLLKPGMTADELISRLRSEGLLYDQNPVSEWIGDYGLFGNGNWAGVVAFHFKSATYYVRYVYPKNVRDDGPIEIIEVYRTVPTAPYYLDRQKLAYGYEVDTQGRHFDLFYKVPKDAKSQSQVAKTQAE